MYLADRRLRSAIAAVLVAVAILGYVAGGHGRSAAASVEKVRSVVAGGVLVGAPMAWQRAAAAPAIPGLAIANPVVFAPERNAANAGFLTGQFAGGQPSPLSAGFLASLPALPHTEVVNLVESQAYRYSNLSVPGFDRMLTVYAIPNPGGDPTAVACYASRKLSAYMGTCERMVATLTLLGHTHSYDLTPEPGYAREVSQAVGTLDRQRVLLRREMHERPVLSNVQSLATRLADGFAGAAASLSVLEPPLVASKAQAVLKRSLARAGDAYAALAAAAAAGSPAAFNGARTQVDEAEANTTSALHSFATLGYE
jgi:hypothetical protein